MQQTRQVHSLPSTYLSTQGVFSLYSSFSPQCNISTDANKPLPPCRRISHQPGGITSARTWEIFPAKCPSPPARQKSEFTRYANECSPLPVSLCSINYFPRFSPPILLKVSVPRCAASIFSRGLIYFVVEPHPSLHLPHPQHRLRTSESVLK